MTFALFLQLPNHIRFKRPIDIWANFVPQLIFLQSIFGYLVICILYKWSIDWSTATTQPPSLLNMLISMFLEPGTVAPETQLYAGQGFVQLVLLGLAAICVPWLLITKPYVAWRDMKRIQDQGYTGLVDTPRDTDDVLEGEEEGAIAEDADDEHVRTLFIVLISVLPTRSCLRNNMTLGRSLSIKSSIPSSSVLAAFHTPLLICGSGPCRLHMPSCRRSCGR